MTQPAPPHRRCCPAPATTSTAALGHRVLTCLNSASLLSGLIAGFAGPQPGRLKLELLAGAAACTIILRDDHD